MNKTYYIYVLQCADNTLYCGYTNDVEKRFTAHNTGKGAKYTKARLPVKLLTSVTFENKSDALKCEWWFKNKLKRKEKLLLISKHKIREEFEKYEKTRQK
ncbi:GIY-YIG nuclease family protein [Lactococcus nasutitermitis]|uniref:GIY-YIG nuclease family protein n=1 Tax=Lactococcus nasutitermitis TaxID=1652957 RepID=A0ABV9JFP9_9LACT|nr:GIY-YIG nuclease family protein [Lactococcus nasutitermitis]